MSKVSVVMPVHNTKEEYLREAIESILNQTFTDFEFIIIDDSSTNIQGDVIKEYKDDRINYRRVKSLSLPNALNLGLELSNGEYIARMDADDISLSNRFEKQVKFLDSNKDISILGTLYETFPQKSIIANPENPKLLDFCLGCAVGHPTVMFRKADFDKFNLKYNEKYYCEDYDLWARAAHILKFYNLQEVLLLYRNVETKKSNLNLLKLYEDSEKVKINILKSLVSNHNLEEYLKTVIVQPDKKTISLWQKIFSIKKHFSNFKMHTVIRILGLKITVRRGF